MGRAQITSHLGEGLYQVSVEYDRSAADRRLIQMRQLKGQIEHTLTNYFEPTLQAVIVAEGVASASLQDAILTLSALRPTGTEAEIHQAEDEVKTATRRLADRHAKTIRLHAETARARLELLATDKTIERLEALVVPATVPAQAWCADYSLALAGPVGTIEVGRVGSTAPILRPGGGYDGPRDGRLTQTAAMPPEAAFHAMAMLPGVGKWRPRYRVGAISAVDPLSLRCSVTLDDPIASPPAAARRYNLNVRRLLTAVPFEYMGTAGPHPFVVGDRVVVEFRNTADPATSWDDPWVIGFESEPRPILSVPRWLYHGARLTWAQGVPPITWYIWGAAGAGVSAFVPWGPLPSGPAYPENFTPHWIRTIAEPLPEEIGVYPQYDFLWPHTGRISTHYTTPAGAPAYWEYPRLDVDPADARSALCTWPMYPQDPEVWRPAPEDDPAGTGKSLVHCPILSGAGPYYQLPVRAVDALGNEREFVCAVPVLRGRWYTPMANGSQYLAGDHSTRLADPVPSGIEIVYLWQHWNGLIWNEGALLFDEQEICIGRFSISVDTGRYVFPVSYSLLQYTNDGPSVFIQGGPPSRWAESRQPVPPYKPGHYGYYDWRWA